MTKEPKLLRKPSALIRPALRDLRAVEADPRYRVDLDNFRSARHRVSMHYVCSRLDATPIEWSEVAWRTKTTPKASTPS